MMQVVYGFDYMEDVLDLLEEHITDNIVRVCALPYMAYGC
jgi:hypothetical protein